jgi:hypothetical protein
MVARRDLFRHAPPALLAVFSSRAAGNQRTRNAISHGMKARRIEIRGRAVAATAAGSISSS